MQERDIFIEALQKQDPADRGAYLHAACAGDAGLRTRVERLLLEHTRQESFILDSPAVGLEPDLDPTLFAPPGTMIGRYKVLEPIGEGGYGTVFMAEQTNPVQRRVALKIIKPGMDTRHVIARFEAERQALALMDHPNIAKVFDAGVTESGRPYFVMELVKGLPITRYCDERRLPPRERLELFIHVCQAVQHAHQKGIIHRDLKPTNVLVAQYDGKPVPKVIDFGVAKATGQQLTERTMFTGFGDVIGTPQYMSPEQAELNQLDVDTRSDIYSLGVLLYELLTGTTPLEGKRVREAALLEVLRVIREEEPPRPSTRLTTVAELPSIAAQRGLEPKSLSGVVRGELDWIVMKALEKDRAQRYETANGLAHDIERYLRDEQVLACPPSAAYQLHKLLRRHRGPVAAGAAFVLVLVAGTIGTAIGMRRALLARDAEAQQRSIAQANEAKARSEADRADREAKTQQAINQFLNEMLEAANPFSRTVTDPLHGKEITVAQALDIAVRKLDAGALKDRPHIEVSVRNSVGRSYMKLQQFSKAEAQLREALRLSRNEHGPEHLSVGRRLEALAHLLHHFRKKTSEAEPLAREALAMLRKFGAEDAEIARVTILLLEVLQRQGKLAEAEGIGRELLASNPSEKALVQLADILVSRGQTVEAERLYQQILQLARAQLGKPSPDGPFSEIPGLFGCQRVAYAFRAQGRFAEAEALYRQILPIARQRLGSNLDVATMWRYLGDTLVAQGKLAEAEAAYRECLPIARANGWRMDPTDKLIKTLEAQGKRDDVEELHRQRVEADLAAGGESADVATSIMRLGRWLEARGRLAEAEQQFRRALALRRTLFPEGSTEVSSSLSTLINVLKAQGKAAEAQAFVRFRKEAAELFGAADPEKAIVPSREAISPPARASPP